MGIGGMQEIQLAPFQRGTRGDRCALGIRLRSANMANVCSIVARPVTVVTCENSSGEGDED